MHDGYRRRNDVFLIALLVSLALHAATILLAPGFRRPAFKMAQTMNVLLMPPTPPPAAPPEQRPAPVPETAPAAPKVVPQPSSPPAITAKPESTPPLPPEPKTQTPQPAVKPAPPPKPVPKPKPKHEPKPLPKRAKPEAIPPQREMPHPHRRTEPPVRHRTAPAPAPEAPAQPPSAAKSPSPPVPSISPAPPRREARRTPPIDDLLDRYGKNLARIVAGGQHYPRIAQMRGWQGTVEIEVTVAPPGKADGIAIRQSSGHTVLDDEALDMVKRALPLPPPPRALRDRTFTVVVPIVFRLQ
ncbi:MAG TPA: energy transducer TonB [Burkholderiales bacterium]|nr:energy transducer TonB [Burkholderiales bacterium]